VLDVLNLERGRYFLVTLHRAENVDVEQRLSNFAKGFGLLSERYGYPVIVSTHPRTSIKMRQFGVGTHCGDVRFLEPFGLFDFRRLVWSVDDSPRIRITFGLLRRRL
jgi:UDP-N-acetylglucosamine 2-epimerase